MGTTRAPALILGSILWLGTSSSPLMLKPSLQAITCNAIIGLIFTHIISFNSHNSMSRVLSLPFYQWKKTEAWRGEVITQDHILK